MTTKEEKRTRLREESPELIACKKPKGGGGDQEEDKKMLYIFFRGGAGWDHSLYCLDVPLAADPPPTTTIDELHRVSVDPVLEFESSGGWPAGMKFAALGRKLYFLGGFSGDLLDGLTYHREVYVLDLNTFSSATELRSYRDKPDQILKPGPMMISGKIDPTTFVCDGQIFVLSAREKCIHGGYRVTAQFERLKGGENQQWEVRAKPNFPSGFRLSAHVQVERKVIVSGYVWRDYHLYSYDLDNDSWSEFDTTGWTSLMGFGFVFSDGSIFIRGGIYGVYAGGDVPLVMRLEKQEGESEALVLTEDQMHDVIKYDLPSPRVSGTLTCLGGVDKMCYIQVGNPPSETDDPRDFNSEKTMMSLSLFDAHVDPPRFLQSAHYVTYPGRSFTIVDAFFV